MANASIDTLLLIHEGISHKVLTVTHKKTK